MNDPTKDKATDEPIWSAHLARKIAEMMSYSRQGDDLEANRIAFSPEAEKIVAEMTEAFRYLGPRPTRLAEDFADFLHRKLEGSNMSLLVRRTWAAERLAEVRDLILFLRERYGEEQPADEKDYWTEEDIRDAQAAVWQRLDKEDPYPWEEAEDAGAG